MTRAMSRTRQKGVRWNTSRNMKCRYPICAQTRQANHPRPNLRRRVLPELARPVAIRGERMARSTA
jgi:hypothetical protein